MIKKYLISLLLLSSWTVLLGQTRASRQDSLICFTPSEMIIINHKLISGNECDTLLKISNAVIVQKDTTIASLERTIILEENRHKSTLRLAKEYMIQRDLLTGQLKTANNQKKLLKAGWAGTSLLLITTTILALIK